MEFFKNKEDFFIMIISPENYYIKKLRFFNIKIDYYMDKIKKIWYTCYKTNIMES